VVLPPPGGPVTKATRRSCRWWRTAAAAPGSGASAAIGGRAPGPEREGGGHLRDWAPGPEEPNR